MPTNIDEQIATLITSITHDHEKAVLLELLQALHDSQAASEFLLPSEASPKKALSLLEKAIALNLPSWLAWHRHGLALFSLKTYESYRKAIPSLETSIWLNQDREWHSSCHLLVDCYKFSRQYETGASFFKQLSGERPDWWLSWHDRGVMGYWMDNSLSEDTISFYLKAIELYHEDPKWIWSVEDLRSYFKKHNALEKGLPILENLTQKYPQYWILWHGRAWLEMKLGYHQTAITSYQTAIRNNPDGGWFWSWNDLGEIYFNERRNFKKAAEAFSHAVKQAPKTDYGVAELSNLWLAYQGLGNSHKELGEYEIAIQAYEEVEKLNKHHPIIYYLLGVCREENGEPIRAFENYTQLLQVDSTNNACRERRDALKSVLRVKLLEFMDERFELEELKTLCFRLNVKYSNLPAEGLNGKARELIAHLERISDPNYHAILNLINEIRALRPGIPLP